MGKFRRLVSTAQGRKGMCAATHVLIVMSVGRHNYCGSLKKESAGVVQRGVADHC